MSNEYIKDYETVFILNPVLSIDMTKSVVDKHIKMITDAKMKVVNVERWGLRKLAYPIQKKTSGFYVLIEYKAQPDFIKNFEVELSRDESVMRFMTITLDKDALIYNQRRREGAFDKKKIKDKEEIIS